MFVARVGHSGGVVETQAAFKKPSTGAFAPAATFDENAGSFMLAYCTYDLPSLLPVYAARLVHSPDAIGVPYGIGCSGAISSNRPYAGHQYFDVSLSTGAATPNQLAMLWIGLAPTAIDLTPAGMMGCHLNTGPIAIVNALTDSRGAASVTLPLPDAPAIIGDIYLQWVFVSPSAAWPLKFATTRGLRAQIR